MRPTRNFTRSRTNASSVRCKRDATARTSSMVTIVRAYLAVGEPVLYDDIGGRYGRHRRADPAIARMIDSALGSAPTVLSVGAGTGSYEPPDRLVMAVEPSSVMIRQ